ncbi:MAG: serine hydroxymethyltransferase [Candidatus Thermoplasmatota archaeon]|nr:serine hydroxymethyltransferase [Candidatus Thermoplasmatota archaeon]MBU1940394.1 serine hydroxymethyltransferase [Candidatus Thermoplasmatota archaeon]
MSWYNEVEYIRTQAKKNNELFASSLPMIASENVLSPLCREMLITDFHGRYAEGTPGHRYYEGCDIFDKVEEKAIELAKKLFSCHYADVRPTAGTTANIAILKALIKPGETACALDLANGAHISFGKWGAAGVRGINLISYPFNDEEMNIDIDGAVKLIKKVKPKLALNGRSVFLFPSPIQELAEAAHNVGAYLVYDAAHVLGLIAGKQFQDPLREGADVMSGSTHKTLPGPQGGMIVSNHPGDTDEDRSFLKKLSFGVFPGVTSSYHLHHVAAKAIAYAEHLEFGKAYAKQTIQNAQHLAQELHSLGFQVFGEKLGFTKSHQILLAIGPGQGKQASKKIADCGIITNMNTIPGDEDPLNPSGLRLGTQELTRIGMKKSEMEDVALFYKRALIDNESPKKLKKDIKEFRKEYQTLHYCFKEGFRGYDYHTLVK